MTSLDQQPKGSDGPAADARLLEAAYAALPFGLRIARGDGSALYANPLAAVEASPDRHLATASAAFTHDGQPFTVQVTSDVTEQRKLEDSLFRKAYFDDLTGLPNRSLFESTVNDMLASGSDQPFALAFLDVDNFKHINDFFGHAAGDALLVKLARRVADQLRTTDLVARVGGDEFLLLISPLEAPEALAGFFDRLIRQLNNPFFIDGQEVFSSTSIGVSLYPDHGRDYATLCDNADTAMYRLKSSCKGGIKLFEQAIGQAVSERQALEQRLRLAIRDRRLCCAYQPKFDFRTQAVVGLEVLLRWRDEQGTIQPPGAFLSLATELGLMDEIAHIVLDETIAAIDSINEAFGPAVSLSVNVAAKQAADVPFMRSLTRSMAQSGFADRFMVEITEEAFLSKTVFQTEVLPLLRQHGIRVSIDDFGIGYSSLSALADLTADEIKVDRSFITNIQDRPRSQVILKALESLGRALGMDVLVEGVETVEELAYLQATTQIRFAQGFYFAKPMMLEDLGRADIANRTRTPARNAEPARRSLARTLALR